MTPTTKWIVAIVGLLAANVIGTSVLIVSAHTGASRVLPAYYERAVHYDDTIDEAARDRALGWSVDATITGGTTRVAVRDRVGTPIADARVTVDAIERADHAATVHAEANAAGGAYVAAAPVRGWVDAVVTVVRGADRYVLRTALEAR